MTDTSPSTGQNFNFYAEQLLEDSSAWSGIDKFCVALYNTPYKNKWKISKHMGIIGKKQVCIRVAGATHYGKVIIRKNQAQLFDVYYVNKDNIIDKIDTNIRPDELTSSMDSTIDIKNNS